MTLRGRLLLALAYILLLAIIALEVPLAISLRDRVDAEVRSQARSQADVVAATAADAGRLQGEIPLGYYLVRREAERIDDFDPELAQALFHIVLSHHGTLENGSPVLPATR